MIFLKYRAPLNGGKRKCMLHVLFPVIVITPQKCKFPIRLLTSQTDLNPRLQ